MSTAYDNFGDELPGAGLLATAPAPVPPAPPKPAAASRGDGFRWTGVLLIVLAFVIATFPAASDAPILAWLGLFLAGTINLATAGLIRAITDTARR